VHHFGIFVWSGTHNVKLLHCTPNTVHSMYIQQLTAVILLPSQNTVAVRQLISLNILHQVICGLVTVLKVIDATIRVSDVVLLAGCLKI